MRGVTDWVRKAFVELGEDATFKAVADYILKEEPTIPKSQISLAMRKLQMRRSHERHKRIREKAQPMIDLQREIRFPE